MRVELAPARGVPADRAKQIRGNGAQLRLLGEEQIVASKGLIGDICG